MKSESLFYIQRTEENVSGPYDLVQMAGLLRKKIITADTHTRLVGEENWQPFSWQPQFSIAREMPADAASLRIDTLNEEALTARSPIPVPSAQHVFKFVAAAVVLVVVGVIVFLISWANEPIAVCLAVAGAGASVTGSCLLYVRLADESFWTIFRIFFFPFYDIYYFLANFWDYLPSFGMRYLGATFAVAALAGIAVNDPASAKLLATILHLFGL